jgi:putative PIN family toxin of toxin-antitoxin system
MQKVVIDTNVIVSALIQRSYPYLIINQYIIEDKFQLCISDELMAEYYEVLARPKFAKFQDFYFRAESLIVDIETRAKKFIPSKKINIIKDTDDNKILELADECFADYIITGNTNDVTFSTYKLTKIVKPKDYIENHLP